MPEPASEAELREFVSDCVSDPLGFVIDMFPWGRGELEKHPGPREWQADLYRVIGEHLQNDETRFTPLQIAVASGHGIGKSAFVAQLLVWGMSTCDDCRIVVTANTESQLRTKTWPEVKKWVRLAINSHWFNPTATALFIKDPEHQDWRADAVPWSENNAEAFAGLHNQGKRIIVVMDEASAVPPVIWETIKGALTDTDTEILFLAFGNPTRSDGEFRECFRKNKKRWVTRQIDSRTVEGTNKAEIAKWVEDYGEDSDFVKVRVRGIFPNISAKQFFAEGDVDAAWGKHLRDEQYAFAPKIIACDPAWEGDDMLEIGLRQGLAYKILRTIPKNDNDIEIAQIIAGLEDDEQADAVFLDAGYGTGIVSAGRTWGREWQLVWFAGQSSTPGYANKRAEMAHECKRWLKQGGAIPASHELRDDLLAPETVPRVDGKVQLESKKEIKKRLGRSPGKADALLLTFAFPVSKRMRGAAASTRARGADYDPFQER